MQQSNSKQTEQSETETYSDSKPKVLFNGDGEHYWVFEKEEDGIKEYTCKHCPMGKRLREGWEVVDGRVVSTD